MAINFCSVNISSIDTLCGSARVLVLTRLLNEKYPIPITGVKSNPQTVRYFPEQRDEPVLNFEQPFITVEVDFLGLNGTERHDKKAQNEFVVVSDLDLSQQITVNISDLEI